MNDFSILKTSFNCQFGTSSKYSLINDSGEFGDYTLKELEAIYQHIGNVIEKEKGGKAI